MMLTLGPKALAAARDNSYINRKEQDFFPDRCSPQTLLQRFPFQVHLLQKALAFKSGGLNIW